MPFVAILVAGLLFWAWGFIVEHWVVLLIVAGIGLVCYGCWAMEREERDDRKHEEELQQEAKRKLEWQRAQEAADHAHLHQITERIHKAINDIRNHTRE